MALTFFGALAGNLQVSVVPARLEGTALRFDSDQETTLRDRCRGLPALACRSWLWSALSIHAGGSADVADAMMHWPREAGQGTEKLAARVASLRIAERCPILAATLTPQRLLDFHRKTVDVDVAGFREQSVRFGRIGTDEVFSQGLHWQAVPGYVDDLCAFVRSSQNPSLGAIITVFRQLILIHPFRDGNGRCARALVASLCASMGWPRYVLLPALLAFRADEAGENAYSNVFAAANSKPFIHYVLSITHRAIEAVAQESLAALSLQQQLLDSLMPATFGRRLLDRLATAPCMTTQEFAGIARSSERNALRWLQRLSEQSLFDLHDDLWFWRPMITFYRRLDVSLRAAIH
jgi:fido (protein-threonine AMPylation protein)